MNTESQATSPRNGTPATAEKASKFLSGLNRFATSNGPTLTRDEPMAMATTAAHDEPAATGPVVSRSVEAKPAESAAGPQRAAADSGRNEPAESARATPAGRARPTRRKSADADRLDRTFEVAAGRGVRVLTARIPRDLHARVYLVATNNRFAERDAPQTINELVMDALHEWLDRHDAA